MPLVDLPIPALFSRSSDETSLPDQIGARLVNGWVEKIGQSAVIRKAFGTVRFDAGDITTSLPMDGAFWWDAKEVMIAVSSGNIYVCYNASGDFTDITGDALTVIGPVTFASNQYQAILASGGRMVSLNVENLPSTTPALAIGSTTTKVANGAFTYYIGQTAYSWPANAVGITTGDDVVPQGKFGAIAIDVYGTGFPILPGLKKGSSNAAHVKCENFSYYISGTLYNKTSAETAPGNDEIVATKYGAVAFDIGVDGTIDAIEATNQVVAEFTSAALAIAALPAAASGHIRRGYVTASKSDGPVVFGTTLLSDANSAVVYTDSTDTSYTVVEAAKNADGYASAAEAVQGLPNAVSTKCRIGTVTAMKNDGAFTFGTTALNAAGTTVAYTSYLRNSNTHIQASRFISDADAPTAVSHVSWMDGYFLANELNSARFHWSNADEPFLWSSLSFASAEGHPDKLVALHTAWLEVTLFGAESLETYYDDGDSPFSRIEGGVLERGCIAPYSIENCGGIWVWLDSYRRVVTLQGRQWAIKSGPYDEIISKIVDVSTAYSMHCTFSGASFYVLTFPSVDLTVVWNMTTDSWSEWGTWDSDTAIFGRWIGKCYCYARTWDKHLLGGSTDSIIYEMEPGVFQEDGASIRTLMRMAHMTLGTTAQKRETKMRINVKRGQGKVGGAEPVFAIRHNSDNHGWSNEVNVGLGDIGENQHIIEIRGLGTYHSRQWEFLHTDNSDFILNGIEVEVEKMEE